MRNGEDSGRPYAIFPAMVVGNRIAFCGTIAKWFRSVGICTLAIETPANTSGGVWEASLGVLLVGT